MKITDMAVALVVGVLLSLVAYYLISHKIKEPEGPINVFIFIDKPIKFVTEIHGGVDGGGGSSEIYYPHETVDCVKSTTTPAQLRP